MSTRSLLCTILLTFQMRDCCERTIFPYGDWGGFAPHCNLFASVMATLQVTAEVKAPLCFRLHKHERRESGDILENLKFK